MGFLTLRIDIEKSTFFRTLKNQPKWASQSNLWRPRTVFSSKSMTFSLPFGIDFSTFFQKWRKCEISEEYNAKRGSEPSKTSHFRVDFSLNVHVFSEPPSRDHFWRVQAPVYTQNCVFGPIFDFQGIPKSIFGATFSATRPPKELPAKCREPPREEPGADPGAIWHRKHPKDAFFSIWDRFW